MTQRHRLLVAAIALVLSACATEAASVEPQQSAEPATAGGATMPTRTAVHTDPTTDPVAAPGDRAMPDLAVLSHDGSVVMVRDGVATPATRGIVASDQATLVEATVDGATTSVAFVDLATGVESSRHELAGAAHSRWRRT
jgi:PBP1b-binding outer membrane lipoprotein LpoB